MLNPSSSLIYVSLELICLSLQTSCILTLCLLICSSTSEPHSLPKQDSEGVLHVFVRCEKQFMVYLHEKADKKIVFPLGPFIFLVNPQVNTQWIFPSF